MFLEDYFVADKSPSQKDGLQICVALQRCSIVKYSEWLVTKVGRCGQLAQHHAYSVGVCEWMSAIWFVHIVVAR